MKDRTVSEVTTPRDPTTDSERRPKRFYVLLVVFLLVLTGIVLIPLEMAAGYVLSSRVAMGLPIFECLLCDDLNVFKPKAHYRGRWETGAFSVEVRTNSHGYREDADFTDADIDIAFMGDSYTFGQGVEAEDRYSNVAARLLPDKKVVALTYNNGFQPEHYEYFLGMHPDLRPEFLFIGLYLGNDLDSDLRETVITRDETDGRIESLALPYRELFHGALTSPPAYKYRWLTGLVKHTNLGKITAIIINNSSRLREASKKADRILPNTANRLSTELGEFDDLNLRAITSLKMTARIMEERGGELHVLIIPQNFLFGTDDPHIDEANADRIEEFGMIDALVAICEAEALNCHDLSPLLTAEDYLEEDGHWSLQGHSKAGDYSAGIVLSKGGGDH